MSDAGELNRSLENLADYHEDLLGSWEPVEGQGRALVDARWLHRVLELVSRSERVRREIESLALVAMFEVRDARVRTDQP